MRALALLLLGMVTPAAAEPAGITWTLQYSNFITHFRSDPDHNNDPGLIGIELRREQWLVGGASFRNSFDQSSQYLYVGRRFDSTATPLYAKLTAGVLRGYRGEHKRKIPLNDLGIAPAIIPAVGVQMGRFRSELALLGESALLLSVGSDF